MSVVPTVLPRPDVRFPRPLAVLLAVVGAVLGAMLGPQVASAHTDFEGSIPADGEAVEGPLAEITLDVTNPAVLSGEGVVVLGPDGNLVAPAQIDETDGTLFIVRFDPPLGAGTYGVRWEFQAGDAHPIDGSFSFDVTGPPVTTTTATTSPPDAAPTSTEPAVVAAASATSEPTPPAATGDTTLEDFLADTSSDGEGAAAGRGGRTITFLATIAGIGALAVLLFALRGSRDEIRGVLGWARLAGVGVAVGGLVEFSAAHASAGVSIADMIDSKPGTAALLKVLGGALVWIGLPRDAGRVTGPTPSLSAATAVDLREPAAAVSGADQLRWHTAPNAAIGLVGYALVPISFWFDGHQASRGPWLVHALADLAHVIAAAVWGGGVIVLAALAWSRRRRAEPTGIAGLVVRFSGVATVSLIAVTVAGLVMTWLIVDGFGDVTGTTWGRVLLVKLAAVAAATAIGAYHHLRLVPALDARPDDPALHRELRRTLTVEALLFVAVAVITAVLVASAT